MSLLKKLLASVIVLHKNTDFFIWMVLGISHDPVDCCVQVRNKDVWLVALCARQLRNTYRVGNPT